MCDFGGESLRETQKLLCLWFSWANFTLVLLRVMLLFLHSLKHIIQSLTGDLLPRIARTPYTPVSMCCTPEQSCNCFLLWLPHAQPTWVSLEFTWRSAGSIFGRSPCARTGIFMTLSAARVAMECPWQKFIKILSINRNWKTDIYSMWKQSTTQNTWHTWPQNLHRHWLTSITI